METDLDGLCLDNPRERRRAARIIAKHILADGNDRAAAQASTKLDLFKAAEKVIASWENGDLAAAIRQLDAALNSAQTDVAASRSRISTGPKPGLKL